MSFLLFPEFLDFIEMNFPFQPEKENRSFSLQSFLFIFSGSFSHQNGKKKKLLKITNSMKD